MRDRALHEALRAFAEEAAMQLQHDASQGAEVPFEVVESPGRHSALYCYRPLTGDFIRQRIGILGRLPTYPPAARVLQAHAGLDRYLRARGEPRVPSDPRERADATLRSFLGSVWAETSDFEYSTERFERAYGQLEALLQDGETLSAVIAPLHGLEIESSELELGEGLSLVQGDALPGAPPEAIWASGDPERPQLLVSLAIREGDASALSAARLRFRRLLTALRLYGPGGFSLGPVGWMRTESAPWQVVSLGGTGRPRGASLTVPADQEDELRGFCSLIARRASAGSTRGELLWALARFEMGCERLAPFEALTDHLLALRALLEPEGPGSGRLAARLAAICAVPDGRPALAERVAHAISLERAVVAGLAPAGPGGDALVSELSDHLRALLRDVLCGHLERDLCAVADELLPPETTIPPVLSA